MKSSKRLRSQINKVYKSKHGGGCDKLVEQGLTVCQSFETSYSSPRIDINTVRILSSQGMSRNAIAIQLRCARATVTRAIQKLKTENL